MALLVAPPAVCRPKAAVPNPRTQRTFLRTFRSVTWITSGNLRSPERVVRHLRTPKTAGLRALWASRPVEVRLLSAASEISYKAPGSQFKPRSAHFACTPPAVPLMDHLGRPITHRGSDIWAATKVDLLRTQADQHGDHQALLLLRPKFRPAPATDGEAHSLLQSAHSRGRSEPAPRRPLQLRWRAVGPLGEPDDGRRLPPKPVAFVSPETKARLTSELPRRHQGDRRSPAHALR